MRGVRTAGRIAVLLGFALAFVWMFTPLAGGSDSSLWQYSSRFDIVMALGLIAGIGLGITALVVDTSATDLDRALCFIAGSTAGVLALFALEDQWHAEPILVLFAGVVIVMLVVGTTLLSLRDSTAMSLATRLAGARINAARRATAVPAAGRAPAATPVTTPAGWYPDPSGQFSMRYWDGRTWTDSAQ